METAYAVHPFYLYRAEDLALLEEAIADVAQLYMKRVKGERR